MNVDILSFILSLGIAVVSVTATIVYIKTKLSVLENDLENFKKDTAKNIEASYNKLQIFIKKMEENAANIRTTILEVKNNLEKETDGKLISSKNEIDLITKKIEKDLSTLSKEFEKFRDLIFNKYDNLKDEELKIIKKIQEVENGCKLITKEYLTRAEALNEFLRRDIFLEKEKIFKDRILELKDDTDRNTDRISKIETSLVEFLTLFKTKQ